jgi:starch phosphorylase
MALEELGIDVDICHLNEGHAAFAVIARAYTFMKKAKVPISVAIWATRAGNIFTTHTPVAAGFDSFEPDLIRQYAQTYADMAGVSIDELRNLGSLGRVDPERVDRESGKAPLVMAVLATRGSYRVNGVSRLHGEVKQRSSAALSPLAKAEVPVTHVTNESTARHGYQFAYTIGAKSTAINACLRKAACISRNVTDKRLRAVEVQVREQEKA